MLTHLSLLACLLVVSYGALTEVINPGCPGLADCPSADTAHNNKTWIAHITSPTSDKLSTHFVWSFITGYTPTMFLFQAQPSAEFVVDYTKLKTGNPSGAFAFHNGSVSKAYGMEIEAMDFRDDNGTSYYTLPMTKLNWGISFDDSKDSLFQFESINKTDTNGGLVNGTLAFNASVYTTSGRYDRTPHLAYTDTSAIFNLQLNRIYEAKAFPTGDDKQALFPFANLTFAYEGAKDDFINGDLHKTSSINDEYSPGVFQRLFYEITHSDSKVAYTEWRPVAYYDTDRVIAKSVKVSKPTNSSALPATWSKSLLSAYFRDSNASVHVEQLVNFQFGSADDSYDYRAFPFVSFTMASGFGQVQEDSLSGTVKIVLFVGLGVPAVLVLVSAVYTVYLKCGTRKPDFETLEE